jgi:hypothetical protein
MKLPQGDLLALGGGAQQHLSAAVRAGTFRIVGC